MAPKPQYRQGDVLLERVEEIPEGARAVEREQGRLILAYGEATGHAHAILELGAELVEVEDANERFLRVLTEGGVSLTHDEHTAILVPPGDYKVTRQREYSPESIRNVSD